MGGLMMNKWIVIHPVLEDLFLIIGLIPLMNKKIPSQHPAMYYTLIQRGPEMVIEDMRGDIHRSKTRITLIGTVL